MQGDVPLPIQTKAIPGVMFCKKCVAEGPDVKYSRWFKHLDCEGSMYWRCCWENCGHEGPAVNRSRHYTKKHSFRAKGKGAYTSVAPGGIPLQSDVSHTGGGNHDIELDRESLVNDSTSSNHSRSWSHSPESDFVWPECFGLGEGSGDSFGVLVGDLLVDPIHYTPGNLLPGGDSIDFAPDPRSFASYSGTPGFELPTKRRTPSSMSGIEPNEADAFISAMAEGLQQLNLDTSPPISKPDPVQIISHLVAAFEILQNVGNEKISEVDRVNYICPSCQQETWVHKVLGFYKGFVCFTCQSEALSSSR